MVPHARLGSRKVIQVRPPPVEEHLDPGHRVKLPHREASATDVLAMIGILGYAGIRIAAHADDLFVRFAAGGITTWFMVQALINLAVVLRMLPIAGVPLPLVSYGGSALVANLLAVGVLLACARREPEARKHLARKAMRPQPRMTTVVGSRTKQGTGRS